MTKTIRVHTSVRDALKQIRLGETYSRTLAALAGRYQRCQTAVSPATVGHTKETTISVSDDCHTVLAHLTDEMGVSALGDAVAVLVRNWRV